MMSDLFMSDLFSPHALDSLPHYEAVIERGLKTFCEVGEALLAIRDGRLYRENHSTFEDYCTSRWGMTQRRAYQMMDAAKVIHNLESHNLESCTIVQLLPATESQARPLAALLPTEQVEAWQKVIDAAGDNKVTAGQVEQVVLSIVSGRKKSAAILAVKESFANLGTAGGDLARVYQESASTFLSRFENNSVDLLLTDPPYMTDIDDIQAFAHEWLPVALSKVSRTGRAYVCVGAYPDEMLAYLSAPRAGMELAQVLVWTYRNTLGPSPLRDYKLNWQAILYFVGPDAPPLDCPVMTEQFSVQDINAPDGRLANRFHEWQKPDDLAERLVRHSTRPGDMVIDPFAGTGTFLAAASRLGRRALGCEPDAAQIELCRQRGIVAGNSASVGEYE